jgi:hypothetical protein
MNAAARTTRAQSPRALMHAVTAARAASERWRQAEHRRTLPPPVDRRTSRDCDNCDRVMIASAPPRERAAAEHWSPDFFCCWCGERMVLIEAKRDEAGRAWFVYAVRHEEPTFERREDA